MNRVIVSRDRTGNYLLLSFIPYIANLLLLGRHPSKNASFDILSLADQLHQSKSTNPDALDRGKIYFSENPVPDLIEEGKKAFI